MVQQQYPSDSYSSESTHRMTFKIRGMDCAEEISQLKSALSRLVDAESCLQFDLLDGKMIVEANTDTISEEAVMRAVASTGMQAIPWDQWARAVGDDGEGIWERHGRALMCALNGLFLILYLALTTAVWTGGLPEESTVDQLIMPALCVLGAIAGGWFIFPRALRAARRVRPDMHLLMTIAVIGALGIGEWFEAATVTFLFSLALLLESWSVGRARRAIASLMELAPATARYRCPSDGDIIEKPVGVVPMGVTVVVRPSEKIPLDGIVTNGNTTVNQAPITGESLPVSKTQGDEVFAGTLNIDGSFEFEVTRTANDTTLARIIHMVEEARNRRAPAEQWVEKFARYYTPAMMVLALAIVCIPPLVWAAPWGEWFYNGLVILVIACPCALVISTPVSIVAGLATAARAGVLIKGGIHLESPARIKAMAIDKTGTLTLGQPKVQKLMPLNGHTDAELLARAAALESHSEHPLAEAILQEAKQQSITVTPAESFRAIPGEGGHGVIEGRDFWIGSHRIIPEGTPADEDFHRYAASLEDSGHSVVIVGNDVHICGLISLADGIRPGVNTFVDDLHAVGIDHIIMLTGDNEGTARAVSDALGIDESMAELRPEDKADAVRSLVRRFGRVAMVGDGVNDAPALSASSLGIAMGAAGTDAAIETADIALMADELSRIPWLIRHSRRTLAIIKQNITVALGLKVVFLGLTMVGMASLWAAIAADMGASLAVIANALRLLQDRSIPNINTPKST